MTIYEINPLDDSRWMEFLLRHPRASVFHSPEWLRVLYATYGFTPIAYTTSAPSAPLENGLVFCNVETWATRSRLVSLPFSDYCEPLVDDSEVLRAMLTEIRDRHEEHVKYIELRPIREAGYDASGFFTSEEYCHHAVDLHPELEEIFRGVSKNERSMVRRAEKRGVECTSSTSEEALRSFYRLVMLTRQRHSLPPQPVEWYRNIIKHMNGRAAIILAHTDRPVGGILTLRFKASLVCKYICSDYRFRADGIVPALLWKAIRDAKASGCTEFDLGRTDVTDEGVLFFKRRWGGREARIRYWRYPRETVVRHGSWQMKLAKQVFAHVPRPLLPACGSVLYKHAA